MGVRGTFPWGGIARLVMEVEEDAGVDQDGAEHCDEDPEVVEP